MTAAECVRMITRIKGLSVPLESPPLTVTTLTAHSTLQ
jgi:hypothetical protein